MSYIDTSIIIAALDPTDSRMHQARRVLEEVRDKIISELVLVELTSVLSRRRELISNLAKKLGLSEDLLIMAVLLYIIKRFNLTYKAVRYRVATLPLGRVYMPLAVAMKLSTQLKLKTLDLLHAAYIKLLKDEGEPIHTLVTADSDFEGVKRQLGQILGVTTFMI